MALPNDQSVGLRLRLLATAYDRTLRDVARDAGIAHATLSRVVNGNQRISTATLARIETAIRGDAP